MNKRLLIVLMVMAVIVAAMPVNVGAQEGEGPAQVGLRPDAPPYALHGPYAVGTMDFTIEDAQRPLSGTLWYPALNPNGLEETVTYDMGLGDLLPPPMNEVPGKAIREADPDTVNGPYPLVVSSHGLNGTYHVTDYLHEHLASQGFVVFAFYHPGSSLPDAIAVQNEEQGAALWESNIDNLVLRQQDVTRVIDYAETLSAGDGLLSGLIDMERVAMIGYSYGGYTALGVGGGQFQFSYLAEFCPQGIQSSMLIAQICTRHGADLPALEQRLMALAGIDVPPGELWPTLGDPRIDVLVPIFPGANQVLGTEGLAGVTLPVLMFKGGSDQVAVPQYNVDLAWDHVGSANKTLVTLENANHLVVGACPPMWQSVMWESCSDAVWDLDRAHDLINHFTTAFLLAELYGDADAATALTPDAVSFPGIAYETTGF
jgi:predicted dienelactone hydrolase